VKLLLPDALHARPADLLVRRAAELPARVVVHCRGKRADARKILEVLALGAQKGESVELESDDPESLAAIAALITQEFDPDLVPARAASVVEGIAIGHAVVLVDDDDGAGAGTVAEERARVVAAFACTRSDVSALLARLPAAEAALFAPELTILEALEGAVLARVEGGERATDAVRGEASGGPTDLVDDARQRLLDAIRGTVGARERRLAETAQPTVLVVEGVTPSLVAVLPAHVVGVIALTEDEAAGTSHAAILARGRGLPLAYVAPHVAAGIEDGAALILDTTTAPARIWSGPSETTLADATRRRDALAADARVAEAQASTPLALVAVRVNVGSTRDHVPAGAEGIGLLRTELVFADRERPPSEDEQAEAYGVVAAKTTGPVVIRLFDAGGDKPLAFLPGEARGIALLRAHPGVLAAQLRAIARVDRGAVLIPLVRGREDVDAVRALAPSGLAIGAMVETPEAAGDIDALAAAADFVCIGTNDLSCETLGIARAAGPDALDPRVLAHVRRTVEGAHARGRKVTVCGEIAGDPRGARVLVGLGVDALSVAPARFAPLKLALAGVTLEHCRTSSRSHLP